MLPFSVLSARLEPYRQLQLYKFAEIAIFGLVATGFGSSCITVRKVNMVNLPTASAEWSRIARNLPSDRTRTLNRFTARLRVAYLYDGLKIEKLSTETIRGYEALFSVFLSYTAFELLWAGMAEYYGEKELENERHNFEMYDSDLESKLKSNSKLENYLLHERLSDELSVRIHDFFGNHSSNLMPILAGIRNKVAHGHLSVAGVSADTKRNSEAIWNASRLLVHDTDDLFHSFLLSLD
jgi:hypothetical protein